MKGWIIVIVMALVLGSLIVWRLEQKRGQGTQQADQRAKRKNAPASVEVAVIGRRDIVNTFEATGSVESLFNIKISPKVTGRIIPPKGQKDLVREGTRVDEGELLFMIDSSDLQAQVNQQKAALAEAKYRLAQAQLTQDPADTAVKTQVQQQKAAVASAEADHAQAQKNYQSQISAAESNVIDAQNKVASASTAKENAQSSINSAQANLDNAKAKYDRIFGLYKQGYVAAQDVDDAKTAVSVQQSAVEVAQGQLKSAGNTYNSVVAQQQAAEKQLEIIKTTGAANIQSSEARLQQANAALEYAKYNTNQTPAYKQSLEALQASVDAAKASLDSAKAKLADTTIVSPISGVVTGRYMDPGGLGSPGQPVLNIQALNKVWISIAVPEDVCVKIHLSQTAAVHFDALPNQGFTGRIAQINPSADPTSRQFTVRVVLDNAGNLLKPGMFARVTLDTDRLPNALAAPREAVLTDADGKYVMVVTTQAGAQADNAQPGSPPRPQFIVQRRSVVTGASDATGFAILSGVTIGDKVVTLNSFTLKDGQSVRTGEGDAKQSGGHRRGSHGGGASSDAGGPPAGGTVDGQPPIPQSHRKGGK